MNSTIVAALIAVGGLIIVNIAISIYYYGKFTGSFTEKMKDHNSRISRIEAWINGRIKL